MVGATPVDCCFCFIDSVLFLLCLVLFFMKSLIVVFVLICSCVNLDGSCITQVNFFVFCCSSWHQMVVGHHAGYCCFPPFFFFCTGWLWFCYCCIYCQFAEWYCLQPQPGTSGWPQPGTSPPGNLPPSNVASGNQMPTGIRIICTGTLFLLDAKLPCLTAASIYPPYPLPHHIQSGRRHLIVPPFFTQVDCCFHFCFRWHRDNSSHPDDRGCLDDRRHPDDRRHLDDRRCPDDRRPLPDRRPLHNRPLDDRMHLDNRIHLDDRMHLDDRDNRMHLDDKKHWDSRKHWDYG